MFAFTLAAILLPLLVVLSSLRVIREYERAVVFLLGRFYRVKGPGLIIVVPVIQQMVRVDLRTRVLDVPTQDVISRDNVSVKVNAVVYFRVFEPRKAVVEVENYHYATSQLAQTTLRSVLGQAELDQLLSERDELGHRMQAILDRQTDPWGIKVSAVEVKHVDLPEEMRRAMARQAEAERDKRAKIIHANGELIASKELSEAAEVISRNPVTLQLRYLQTLSDLSQDNSSMIVFPLPLEMFTHLLGARRDSGS